MDAVAAASGARLQVGIVGAGSIGVAWAVAFSRGRCEAVLYEPDSTRRELALAEVEARLQELDGHRLLDEDVCEIVARVSVSDELRETVAAAHYVQECGPERVDVKRRIFREVLDSAGPNAVVATSSSAIPISTIAQALPERDRCLVAHPLNPPYLLPIVELVAAPFTDPGVMSFATRLMTRVGMVPVRVQAEVEGFIANRLQGAILREAYCLVRDGIATVEDVDRVVRDGLGRRWSIIGPFETADLNTRGGIVEHASRMGPAYERMGQERGQHDPWTDELVEAVAAQRRDLLPLERWEERVMWRDRALMALAASLRGND